MDLGRNMPKHGPLIICRSLTLLRIMERAAPGVTFRLAKGSDIEYVADCFVRTMREKEHAEGLAPQADDVVRKGIRCYLDPQTRTGILSRLLGKTGSPSSELFIGIDEKEERVGCFVLRLRPDEGVSTAWIYLVFVEPDHRRKGVGTAMMVKAEEWALANGAISITLNVWPSNLDALHLYERTGYETEKIWMVKKL